MTRATFLFLPLLLYHTPAFSQPQDHWISLDRPTERTLRSVSFIDNVTGWAAGDSGTILKTVDGADTWITQPPPITDGIFELTMVNSTFGWALALHFPQDSLMNFGTTLLRTTNGGSEWFVQSVFPDVFHYAIAFVDSVNGCMGGPGQLFWTSDGGVSWNPAVIDSAISYWPIYRIRFLDSQFAVASGGSFDVKGIVCTTTDGGRFWTYSVIGRDPLFGIHIFDEANIVCVGGHPTNGVQKVWTSNGGQSWQETRPGIWGIGRGLAFRTPSEGWAPLGFAGAYMYSLDSGETWNATYTPDTSVVFDVVFTDSTTGYMVGNNGTVLKYVSESTAIEDSPDPVPHSTILRQNYPNPFNPSTTIRFSIPRSAEVSLKIFNLLGEEVATLISGNREAGTHTARWDATGQPSGVYFYRLRAGEYVETRKLVLVR